MSSNSQSVRGASGTNPALTESNRASSASSSGTLRTADQPKKVVVATETLSPRKNDPVKSSNPWTMGRAAKWYFAGLAIATLLTAGALITAKLGFNKNIDFTSKTFLIVAGSSLGAAIVLPLLVGGAIHYRQTKKEAKETLAATRALKKGKIAQKTVSTAFKAAVAKRKSDRLAKQTKNLEESVKGTERTLGKRTVKRWKALVSKNKAQKVAAAARRAQPDPRRGETVTPTPPAAKAKPSGRQETVASHPPAATPAPTPAARRGSDDGSSIFPKPDFRL